MAWTAYTIKLTIGLVLASAYEWLKRRLGIITFDRMQTIKVYIW